MLGAGDRLPDVRLLDDEGNALRRPICSAGRWYSYFYPKDDTPGCTSEASQFRDLYGSFKKKARIVGVSRDTPSRTGISKQKYIDSVHAAGRYGFETVRRVRRDRREEHVRQEAMGIARSTFLIDEWGKIVKVWPKVNVDEHADEVLSSL